MSCLFVSFFSSLVWYNELSQKTRFQSVRIAALCLNNIQRENLVLKKSLSISCLAVYVCMNNNECIILLCPNTYLSDKLNLHTYVYQQAFLFSNNSFFQRRPKQKEPKAKISRKTIICIDKKVFLLMAGPLRGGGGALGKKLFCEPFFPTFQNFDGH